MRELASVDASGARASAKKAAGEPGSAGSRPWELQGRDVRLQDDGWGSIIMYQVW